MMKTEPKRFSYGVGALAILAISIGAAAIVYSLGALVFDIYTFPAWILGPLGVYTVIYSIVAGSEATYYMVWGTVMVAVAIVLTFYYVVQPLLILGILVIVLAVIGIAAYLRGKK